MPQNNNQRPALETEMLDVVVTLNVSMPAEIPRVVAELQAAGLSVVKVNQLDGVGEGTIEAGKLRALRRVNRVQYVRPRFEYMAQLPSGAAQRARAQKRKVT